MLTPGALRDQGFTVVEVLVAMAVLVIVVTSVASAALGASVAAERARQHTLATLLAAERLEQLRSLAWGLGAAAAPAPTSDVTTDLASVPATAGGGGLGPSPVASLSVDSPGYVDYLDASGRWVGAGPAAPADAAFTRRWRISVLTGAHDCVVLEVIVSRLTARTGGALRQDDVRLLTVKARKAS